MSKPTVHKKSSRYHQGQFKPQNPEKYLGDPTKIVFRSKWEKDFLRWLDLNPKVLKYGSEEVIVKYISPIDHKVHRYYVDFIMQMKQSHNTTKIFLIEVKPYGQTIQPKPPKSNIINESYKSQLKTYLINQAKWEAARKVCEGKGWEFMVITEYDLYKGKTNGNKKR